MCGGEEKAFEAAKPVLEKMGKKIVHCGGAGASQAAKICNNMILGISMIAVSEAFALAEKLGLSHQALFDVASTSSAPVLVLDDLLPGAGPGADVACNNDYKPGLCRLADAGGFALGEGRGKFRAREHPVGTSRGLHLQVIRGRGSRRKDFSGVVNFLRHPAAGP
jgi:3-hydroxyisobutyrate dehydrogenase